MNTETYLQLAAHAPDSTTGLALLLQARPHTWTPIDLTWRISSHDLHTLQRTHPQAAAWAAHGSNNPDLVDDTHLTIDVRAAAAHSLHAQHAHRLIAHLERDDPLGHASRTRLSQHWRLPRGHTPLARADYQALLTSDAHTVLNILNGYLDAVEHGSTHQSLLVAHAAEHHRHVNEALRQRLRRRNAHDTDGPLHAALVRSKHTPTEHLLEHLPRWMRGGQSSGYHLLSSATALSERTLSTSEQNRLAHTWRHNSHYSDDDGYWHGAGMHALRELLDTLGLLNDDDTTWALDLITAGHRNGAATAMLDSPRLNRQQLDDLVTHLTREPCPVELLTGVARNPNLSAQAQNRLLEAVDLAWENGHLSALAHNPYLAPHARKTLLAAARHTSGHRHQQPIAQALCGNPAAADLIGDAITAETYLHWLRSSTDTHSHTREAVTHLTRLTCAQLGTNASHWDTFTELLTQWHGSIADLTRAARALSTSTPRAHPPTADAARETARQA